MMKNYVEEINDMLFELDTEGISYYWDEYMPEAKLINERINSNMLVEEISTICKNVFDEMFLPNHDTTQFMELAKYLKEIL